MLFFCAQCNLGKIYFLSFQCGGGNRNIGEKFNRLAYPNDHHALNTIVGLHRAKEGSILYKGEDIVKASPGSLVSSRDFRKDGSSSAAPSRVMNITIPFYIPLLAWFSMLTFL